MSERTSRRSTTARRDTRSDQIARSRDHDAEETERDSEMEITEESAAIREGAATDVHQEEDGSASSETGTGIVGDGHERVRRDTRRSSVAFQDRLSHGSEGSNRGKVRD